MDPLKVLLWVAGLLLVSIFVHELGHFLAAKHCRMEVERVFIGLPPLVGFRLFGTSFSFGPLPLGGGTTISNTWMWRCSCRQRIYYLLAGSLMGFLFAAIMYGVARFISWPAAQVLEMAPLTGSFFRDVGAVIEAYGILGTVALLFLFNLAISTFNLLPLPGSDGGQILLCLLEKVFDPEKVREVGWRVSLVTVVGMFAYTLYFLVAESLKVF